MKCRVKHGFMLCYGSVNKAWIVLNTGQIWKLDSRPKKGRPWYIIKRNGIILEVMQGEFNRYFEEVADVRK